MDEAEKIRQAWEKAARVEWPWRDGPVFRVAVPPNKQAVTLQPPPDFWDRPDPIEIVEFEFRREWRGPVIFGVITGRLGAVEIEVARDVLGHGHWPLTPPRSEHQHTHHKSAPQEGKV